MNSTRRLSMKLLAGIATGFVVVHNAHALNPQPEVPSKPAPDGRTNPKALNPQPEVPSKPGTLHQQPRALNPQPEVPSKTKKKKTKTKKPAGQYQKP